MTHEPTHCGRVRTVLVFGCGTDVRAILTFVTVRASPANTKDRIQFTGSVTFAPRVQQHLREVVLPLVERIRTALGLPLTEFEVSIANVGATGCHDIGIQVDGFSADAPVLIAALSASLGMEVPPDVLLTGHVASPEGDLAAVRSLPAKLAAAAADPTVCRFIYPCFDRDRSLELLSPSELAAMESALLEIDARGRLRTFAVGDVTELVTQVFAEENMVLASVAAGFFCAANPPAPESSIVGRLVQHLTDRLEVRFWLALEAHLHNGRRTEALRLLTARARLHIGRREYPPDLGRRLLQLLRSLPPTTRRLKVAAPLLPIRLCIELSQFAGESDHADVQLLFDAAAGKVAAWRQSAPQPRISRPAPAGQVAPTPLDLVLSEISAEALAQRIGLPIDAARACFQLEMVTADSYDEFRRVFASFYLHLLRHTRSIPAPLDTNAAAGEALDLVVNAFARDGGVAGAMAEAKDATRGGLRYVIDLMTAHYKRTEQTKDVNRVLRDAINPLDWPGKVAFMKELMDRLGPSLPPAIRDQPPERYAKHVDIFVQHYVGFLDEISRLLRTL
jgi:hypothetical protein